MKKKLIVAAIAAAMVAPMAASADATVYGKVRVATQYHDRDNDSFLDDIIDPDDDPQRRGNDAWGMEDQVSRLGIKGSEDLGNGLKAIYQMEFGVNVGDGTASNPDRIETRSFWSQRNSYVGLAGGWGTFLVGRHDTPHKISSGKLDFFADTVADYDNGCDVAVSDPLYGGCDYNPNGAGQLFNSLRVDGTIAYISPSFSGFTLAGAIVQTDTNAGFEDADDFASAYSIAAMFNQGPWFASLAYETLQADSFGIYGIDRDDDSKWRVGLGILGWSGFSLSGIYEDRSAANFVDNADRKSWQVQAAYDFGNNRVKGMYGNRDDDSDFDRFDYTTWAIGYQYNFSKRTDVQVLYRDLNGDDDVIDDSAFALQLDHAF
jgi:predicted porin